MTALHNCRASLLKLSTILEFTSYVKLLGIILDSTNTKLHSVCEIVGCPGLER